MPPSTTTTTTAAAGATAAVVNTTVMLWWDLDSVHGSAEDVRAFWPHWRQGVTARLRLGSQCRFRTVVFHQHSLHHHPDYLHALPQHADVLDTGVQRVSQALQRKILELKEDYRTAECVLWVVSCDPGVIGQVYQLRQEGFHVFLVTDFDQLSHELRGSMPWLEMFSYYVVAHGDLRKLRGLRPPFQSKSSSRALGWTSPITWPRLRLCLATASASASAALPPPPLSRVIQPPSG